MLSSKYGVQRIGAVDRYARHQSKVIRVPRPLVVGIYYFNMGGTDLIDQNIACYRKGIRGKKWYWSIVTWLVYAMIENRIYLYNSSHVEEKN